VHTCFSLGVAAEDSTPNSNVSKFLELAVTSGTRRLFGQQINRQGQQQPQTWRYLVYGIQEV